MCACHRGQPPRGGGDGLLKMERGVGERLWRPMRRATGAGIGLHARTQCEPVDLTLTPMASHTPQLAHFAREGWREVEPRTRCSSPVTRCGRLLGRVTRWVGWVFGSGG